MKTHFFWLAVVWLCPVAIQKAAAANAPKPNIVYIVADDMGYADCGVQGCKDTPTPHLDSIAQRGIRFTDGYVTGAVCSPTRAALMTGRYHSRDGVHNWIPPGKPGLNAEVPTLADYLKSAGYRTGVVGKWHLGEQPECHPLKRGFDEFYGFLGGGRSYFPDKEKVSNGKMNLYTQMMRGNDPVELTEYTTVAFGREGVEFIQRQKERGQPFFLYLAFNAVHTPMHALEEHLARFANIEDKKRRSYAAMMAAMDEAIGRVLSALKENGFEQNTLVCFHSDNGGPITRNAPNASTNTPLRGGKGQLWEGGIRVPMFVQWIGHLKPGVYSQPVMHTDLTATLVELAGGKPDPKWPMDGVNLLPFLEGAKGEPHASLFWNYENQWAIRRGRWKLAYADPSPREKQPTLSLHDLTTDVSEEKNMASEHPELVKQLQTEWHAWSQVAVLDKPKVGPAAESAPQAPKAGVQK